MIPQLMRRSVDALAKTTSISIRSAHTDIVFPNFDSYRHDVCKDPTGEGSRESVDDRRGLPHAIFYGGFFKNKNLLKLLNCINNCLSWWHVRRLVDEVNCDYSCRFQSHASRC